jgi:hypothetical protein
VFLFWVDVDQFCLPSFARFKYQTPQAQANTLMFATNNQFRDGPSRNVDVGKQESELSINIKKATSPEETAPKRKHVRACIVYTWYALASRSGSC